MAISLVDSDETQVNNESDPGTNSFTISDLGTNGLLVAFTLDVDNNVSPVPDVNGITWNGTSMTIADQVTNAASISEIACVAYLANPDDNGTYDLVIDWNNVGAVSNHYVVIATFSADGALSLTDNNNETGSTVPSMSLTGGDLHLGGYCHEANDVLSPGGSFSVLLDEDLGPRVWGTSYRIATGSQTVSWTGSDDMFAAVCASFSEAGGGGRTTKNTDSNPLGVHTGMGWRINTR